MLFGGFYLNSGFVAVSSSSSSSSSQFVNQITWIHKTTGTHNKQSNVKTEEHMPGLEKN